MLHTLLGTEETMPNETWITPNIREFTGKLLYKQVIGLQHNPVCSMSTKSGDRRKKSSIFKRGWGRKEKTS